MADGQFRLESEEDAADTVDALAFGNLDINGVERFEWYLARWNKAIAERREWLVSVANT